MNNNLFINKKELVHIENDTSINVDKSFDDDHYKIRTIKKEGLIFSKGYNMPEVSVVITYYNSSPFYFRKCFFYFFFYFFFFFIFNKHFPI